jgi:hypothetical protein
VLVGGRGGHVSKLVDVAVADAEREHGHAQLLQLKAV